MNALLVYPQFPDTYWSFKHALSFVGKRAAQPPLGLMTVAALLPASWNKRLVDTNVERLRDRDLAWADVVMLSGMHIQRETLAAIVERCRARGLRTVVGGPIASSVPAAELRADHVVIGEAEGLIAGLQTAMWSFAGLLRQESTLMEGIGAQAACAAGLAEIAAQGKGSRRLAEALAMNSVAHAILQSALARTESRGAHQRADYPERDAGLDRRHFVISGAGGGAFQTWA